MLKEEKTLSRRFILHLNLNKFIGSLFICDISEHLGLPLESYIKQLEVVKIKRIKSRVGLMRARIIGAEDTTGDILTFLDAHIECSPGY